MTEQTATTEPRAATAQAGEMKISISLKGQKAMIGIATAQCDPLWFQMEGLLEEVVARIPGLVVLASGKVADPG